MVNLHRQAANCEGKPKSEPLALTPGENAIVGKPSGSGPVSPGGQMRGKTKSEPLALTPSENTIVGKLPGGGPVPPGGRAIRGKPPGGESVPPGGAMMGLGHSFDALLSYK